MCEFASEISKNIGKKSMSQYNKKLNIWIN